MVNANNTTLRIACQLSQQTNQHEPHPPIHTLVRPVAAGGDKWCSWHHPFILSYSPLCYCGLTALHSSACTVDWAEWPPTNGKLCILALTGMNLTTAAASLLSGSAVNII